MNKLLFLSTVIITSQFCLSQTVLTPGDIIITALYTDAPDLFQFTTLVDLDEGTEIRFTDNGWSNGTLRSGEGTTIYTTPSGGVNAGEQFTLTAGAYPAEFTSQLSGLSASGDSVLAYQLNGGVITPLFIVDLSSSIWHTQAMGTNETDLPTGLIMGSTAVAIGKGPEKRNEIDNAFFDFSANPIVGLDKRNILNLVANPSNWQKTDTRPADPTLSVINNEFKKNLDLKIYPNPVTNGQLHIFPQHINPTISLFSITGKQVISAIKKNHLSTKGISAGTYFLLVENNEKQEVHKILIE